MKEKISVLTFPMTNLRVCCVCKLSLSGPAADGKYPARDRESLSWEGYEMAASNKAHLVCQRKALRII